MNNYEGLSDYLKFITENYRLNLVFNDFVGCLKVDRKLSEVMHPYIIHKNPFCMQIKSDKELWNRCLRMKRGILIKSERMKEPFYGVCYCGVGEYIVPILCDNIVIGVICAGEFCFDRKVSDYRIAKIAKYYGFDKNELNRNFELSIHKDIITIEHIKILLGIVSEYISSIYTVLASTHKELNLRQAKIHSSEAYILSYAVEYIKQNYKSKITVGDIAGFCHCSESYINHIFKKNIKLNVKAYINKLRVEQAKYLLIHSADNIAEIASSTGFSDSNYFSSVFKEISGIPPTEFKKRFRS